MTRSSAEAHDLEFFARQSGADVAQVLVTDGSTATAVRTVVLPHTDSNY